MKLIATVLLLVGSVSWGAGTASALPSGYSFVKPYSGAVWSVSPSGGVFNVKPGTGATWAVSGTVTTNQSGTIYYNYNGFTVTDTGAWINTTNLKSGTFSVNITGALGAGTGATIYVTTTCTNFSGSAPDNSYHGMTIGSVINASGVFTFDGLGCWTKIRINDCNQPTVYIGSVYRPF